MKCRWKRRAETWPFAGFNVKHLLPFTEKRRERHLAPALKCDRSLYYPLASLIYIYIDSYIYFFCLLLSLEHCYAYQRVLLVSGKGSGESDQTIIKCLQKKEKNRGKLWRNRADWTQQGRFSSGFGNNSEKKKRKSLYCRCQDQVLAEWGKLANAAALDEVNCRASELALECETKNRICSLEIRVLLKCPLKKKKKADAIWTHLGSFWRKYVHVFRGVKTRCVNCYLCLFMWLLC